jgi:hypothetical protein
MFIDIMKEDGDILSDVELVAKDWFDDIFPNVMGWEIACRESYTQEDVDAIYEHVRINWESIAKELSDEVKSEYDADSD